jgi:putative ABC transport system permease protein
MGLAIGNGLIGLSGGLIAQRMGFSDIHMGHGSIVIGLASVIIGEVLIGKNSFLQSLVANVFGAVAYRIVIALVLSAGMRATDLQLFTAITVALALFLPTVRDHFATVMKRGIERGKG